MPKRYEAIRDKLLAKGLKSKTAKTRAAKIFNATRKPGQKPVTGKSH
jgi:hypothetical protein